MIATGLQADPVAPTRVLKIALVAAAMAYPLLLRFLFLVSGDKSVAVVFEHEAILAATFVLPLTVPGIGLAALLAMRGRDDADACSVRRLALVLVAVPPLFTATGVVTFLAGIGTWDQVIWWTTWVVSIPLWLRVRNSPCEPKPVPGVLRVGHGIAALLVLLGYVGMHLGNHLAAWWGADSHRAVQLLLRAWYRSPAVEVALVALLIWLIGSGIALLRLYSRRPDMNRYRILQVALGAYVGAFLLSHLTASLWLARGVLGIDPDWTWASGGNAGLLGDPWNVRLIPHYLFAVFAVVAHVGLGARIVLLRHGAVKSVGHAIAMTFGAAGVALALVLTAALLGARL